MEDDRDRDTRAHSCLSLSGKISQTSASSLSSLAPANMTESSQANIDFSLPSSLNSKSSFSLDDTIEEEEDYFEPEARLTAQHWPDSPATNFRNKLFSQSSDPT